MTSYSCSPSLQTEIVCCRYKFKKVGGRIASKQIHPPALNKCFVSSSIYIRARGSLKGREGEL